MKSARVLFQIRLCSQVLVVRTRTYPLHITGKHPDAGKDWRQKENRATEDEMVGWHHWFNGHEFKVWEMVRDKQAWSAAVHGVTKSQTRLGDWTTTTKISFGGQLFNPLHKHLKRTWSLGLAHLLFLGTQTMPPYKRTQSPCWMTRNMWPRHGPRWYPANGQAREWGQARPFGPTSCLQRSTEPAQPTHRVMRNSNN